MENNTPQYGVSPLVAFAEVLRRQRITREFIYQMNRTCYSALNRPKTINKDNIVDFVSILPKSTELKWVEMSLPIDLGFDYQSVIDDMCNAFKIPKELFNENKI